MSEAKIDLIVLSGPSRGDAFHFSFEQSGSVTVGRDASCDLVLADPSVSRKHAVIVMREGCFYLTDMNSSGGTIHMGFRVEPGEGGSRALSNGDEFKIGETLFRIQFDDKFEPSKSQQTVSKKDNKQSAKKQNLGFCVFGRNYSKRIIVLFLLIIIMLSLFLFLPKKKRIVQNNNEISLPKDGIVGYISGKGKKGEVDTEHPDKALFKVSASDVVIEYDFMSESAVGVFLDKFEVETLEPNRDGWLHKQIIIRDVARGQDRTLMFDNLGYPVKNDKHANNKPKTKPTRWAVRNIRISPLSRIEQSGFDAKLANAIGFAEALDKTPSSLFDIQRVLQVAVLDLIDELKIEAVGVPISLESEYFKSLELVELLNGIRADRVAGIVTSEVSDRHLRVLNRVIGRLDAELWRRTNSRLNAAELASDTKDFITAHDTLVGTMEMFSDKGDWRWIASEKMLMDNKIVPRKVRQDPGRYRRRRGD